MQRRTLAPVGVAIVLGAAAGFGLGLLVDNSESDSGERVITINRARWGWPPSIAAERIVMAYVARTYPANPLRSLGCGRPFRGSVACDVLLTPDEPADRCLPHASISVERGRVVDEVRFADCVRGH